MALVDAASLGKADFRCGLLWQAIVRQMKPRCCVWCVGRTLSAKSRLVICSRHDGPGQPTLTQAESFSHDSWRER